MMGLGNGRRSMKSPPLVLAALVACIIVLGFNYWIASSRSVDLQTRIMELEGRVRRAAAERGAVELKKNEFQGELEKQREQLNKIQSSHNFQMESVNKLYQDEKAALINNITNSERLIRTLQDELKTLQKNYGKLQQDVLQFQKNQTNLERKFSYDLSQCISQMKEVKEQCEERIEEAIKKNGAFRELNEKEKQQFQEPSETPPRLQEAGPPQTKGRVPAIGTEETNKIQVISKEETQKDSLGLPPELGQGQDKSEERIVDRQGIEEAGDTGRIPQVSVTFLASQENEVIEEPERSQLIIRDGQEEPEADEKGRNQKKVGDDDYNMDENEAESETDKQAALVWNDQKLNVLKVENQENIDLLDQHEKRNHTI